MKDQYKILMVFPEIAPFSKTGGVGDVGGGMPKFLKEMGHDVRVITPQYKTINERKYILRDVIRLQNIEVPMGAKKEILNVKSAFLPNSKVQVYFIDYKPFFFRDGLYQEVKTEKFYEDNDKRFILFCKGALQTLQKLHWQPDIIHCHEWQAGLIPLLLKTVYKEDPFYNQLCTVFTFRDLTDLGIFPSSCLSLIGLREEDQLKEKDIMIDGNVSFLKAGVLYADIINTVSKGYANEIQSTSNLFQEIIHKRKNRFFGVLDGVDDTVWNPEIDDQITATYSVQDMSGKENNKFSLLESFDLLKGEQVPVVSMISRLETSKGIELVQDVFEDLMNLELRFVILGKGEKQYQKFFNQKVKKHKGRFGFHDSFDDKKASQVIAGSDIFLMPSIYEPGGLTVRYALKYGAVPVVYPTGGLLDSIQPFNIKTGNGNGFVFGKYNSKELLKTMKAAVNLYQDSKSWQKIIKNCMRSDYSWNTLVKKYLQLYGKCIPLKSS